MVLVGASDQDPTTKLLRAGVHERNQKYRETCLSVELATFEDHEDLVRQSDADGCAIGILVKEEVLYPQASPLSPDTAPCLSLAAAERLIRQDTNRRVFLILAAARMTGVDIAAATLMGVAGVLDDRALVEGDVVDSIVTHGLWNRRNRSVLLVGEPLRAMSQIVDLVATWEEDGISANDPKIDPNSWRASMALARLKRLFPVAGASGSLYGYPRLADTLNLMVTVTGFRMSPVDLRKALSAVARRTLGKTHEAALRVTLPERVRELGFPSNPPAITTIPYVDLAGRLYRLVRDADVAPGKGAFDIPHGTVNVARSVFQQLSGLR